MAQSWPALRLPRPSPAARLPPLLQATPHVALGRGGPAGRQCSVGGRLWRGRIGGWGRQCLGATRGTSGNEFNVVTGCSVFNEFNVVSAFFPYRSGPNDAAPLSTPVGRVEKVLVGEGIGNR